MSSLITEMKSEKKSVGTQYSLHENYLPSCGPLSWKIKNDIIKDSSSESDDSLSDETLSDLAPGKLIRSCKESCWAYGHNVLQACGRKRLKDILVSSHECIIDGEKVGHWHYLVMSLYLNDSLEYAHVSVYIHGSKMRNDVAEYVLRNRSCIKKIQFKTQENINDLIRRHYVN